MNYAIILAGGSGTRFWPLSRRRLPKQFLRIVERQSLIEATIRRIRKVIPDRQIFIATSSTYLEEIKRQLRDFAIPKENIILEPSPRNTLPAIALCAQIIKSKDPVANLVVTPSDHFIKDIGAFKQVITKGLYLAREGFLCLIGVRPDSPRSGYGYIRVGAKKDKEAFFVKSFREKPASSQAKKIFGKRDIFWNSGIFCFKADIILQEIKKHLPDVYSQITKIGRKQHTEKAWFKIKPISIDYGILEKSHNLVMLEAKFYWSDLGSWDALSDILPKDKKNNVVLSDCDSVSLDSSGTLVCSYEHKRLIAAVGLKNLIIVDTPDALLVCSKDRAQNVKQLVRVLKLRGFKERL